MQLVARLVRQHVQRVALGGLAAQPFDRLHPGHVARAVVIAERMDLLGENLDFARRRFERVLLGILAEGGQHDRRALGADGFGDTCFPELLERRQCDARVGRLLARLRIEMRHPLHRRAALGVAPALAEALGDLAENPVVVPRFADWLTRLLHGDQEGLARAVADIVALQAGRRRQHDVGHARGRRPDLLVEHDRLGLLPRQHQAVEVLVMVEWIAARPVDQLDVRIGEDVAVVGDLAARVEQHVGDPRDWNEIRHRVRALRQGRARIARTAAAHQVHRSVADAEAAPRQADLPQHASERDQAPEGLLAMVRALQ